LASFTVRAMRAATLVHGPYGILVPMQDDEASDVGRGVLHNLSRQSRTKATLSGAARAKARQSPFRFGMVIRPLSKMVNMPMEFRPGLVGLGLLSGDPTSLFPRLHSES
jgi:hypothetical protein